MEFRTIIDIQKPSWQIEPYDRILFVGSCFADNIGRLFSDNAFCTVQNPYGTMYNPASILHTVERAIADGTIGSDGVDIAFFTLGTNHVYILRETGEIVDNCQKRPQKLFLEQQLSVEECSDYLNRAINLLRELNPDTRIVVTVSPIRYRKYGYHGSQLSKATLLLSTEMLHDIFYFPAYEIVNDELRDYRFYDSDMLHPSHQAVEYIYERLAETFFSKETHQMQREWQPIKAALAHRPFNPDGEEYKAFLAIAMEKKAAFTQKYHKR